MSMQPAARKPAQKPVILEKKLGGHREQGRLRATPARFQPPAQHHDPMATGDFGDPGALGGIWLIFQPFSARCALGLASYRPSVRPRSCTSAPAPFRGDGGGGGDA